AILLLLQGSIAGDKSLTDVEIPEVTNFIQNFCVVTNPVGNNLECAPSQKVYDQMLRKYDDGKLQLETYRHKIVALRLENEKILAEEKAEKEQQKALEAKEAAITEASQLIATYAHAFLTRRAAAIKSKSKGRR
ncbi:unnamed protein product, partial [Hymenolepis diminuta]